MKRTNKLPPTLEQYAAFQAAWAYFNRTLFGGKLNDCFLNFSRHRGSAGFFSPHRWDKGERVIHEISLNPDVLKRPAKDSMSTLVHEMTHQWEQDHGTPPRKGYHDTQWARKMWEIGLIPSDTGQPGGKETGQKMDHYIDPAGKFMKAFRAMPDECKLPWLSGGSVAEKEREKKPLKKIKLICPECERVCWVAEERSPDEIDCGDCDERMLTKEKLKHRKENDRG